jgi:group I intron endonuclease
LDGLILWAFTAARALDLINQVLSSEIRPTSVGLFFCIDTPPHGVYITVVAKLITELTMKVIYRIRNVVNHKFYVGSTTNPRERFRTHRNKLRAGKHHCQHLQAAWNKYGEDCFKFEVLELLSETCDLQAAEDQWLAEHFGKEHCYNTGIRSGAPWRGVPKERHPSFGRPKTEAERTSISATLKGFYAQDIANHPRFGKTHSEETKAKIRAAKLANPVQPWLDKSRDEVTRKKIGDAQRGKEKAPRVISAEGRAKIRAAAAAGRYSSFKGRKHKEESKAKMRKTVFAKPDGIMFPSLTSVLAYYGMKMPTLRRALKTGLPISKGPLAGYQFSYGGFGATVTPTDLEIIRKRVPDVVDTPEST